MRYLLMSRLRSLILYFKYVLLFTIPCRCPCRDITKRRDVLVETANLRNVFYVRYIFSVICVLLC